MSYDELLVEDEKMKAQVALLEPSSSEEATLEEDVTLLNGQTSSSRTGQTSG